ncbi:MAG: hypothetical protein K0R18_555 [Bacillales bacterium]|jgi:phage-related minor tail protein|nr:hypothetical protein [Bacillales bacterium]
MADERESNKNLISKQSIKIDIDCSDALKGLKAVTREAKNATSALKEFEEQQKRFGLSPKLVTED